MNDCHQKDDIGPTTIRAIVFRLMPLLLLAYLVNYVDRINIGFAGAALRHDLGLSATIFGIGAGLFFISYSLFEVPSTMILEVLGARRWIARIMVTWGVLSAGMLFVRGPQSFYLLRFLLGVAEAGFFPGIIFYLVCWFPAAYRARMMALFTLSIPVATVIGAPLSSAFLGISGVWGLPGWQLMFLCEGLPAIVLGVIIYIYLPDVPADARWLSPAQKHWLETALAKDPTRPIRSRLPETLASFLDRRVLALCLIYLCNTSANYSLAFFLPQIVGIMKLGQTATGWIVAIPSATGVIGLLVVGWFSDHIGNHKILLNVTLLVTGIGLAFAALFGAAGASVFGVAALAFAGFGIHGLKAPFWALAPLNMAPAAAAGGIAWINSIGNLGGFFGPSVLGWLSDYFGGYRPGIGVLAAVQLIAIGITVVLQPSVRVRTV